MPAQGMFGTGEILVTGGTFTQINQSQSDTGFTLLSQKISHGAMYDSAERYAAGRCHPGTREEIINAIVEWVNKPIPETDVLWLWGPAGTGKSSILQTVSELLYQSHRTRYVGSFFFAKGVPGRGDSRSLFTTLAYQVACNVDGMRDAVNAAMTFDPLLPSKNMATQFHSLIIDPLLDLPSVSIHTPTIIIDGLDECQGSDDQRAILTLITKSLTACRRVPLRFIIASRPEHAIRDEFDRPLLTALTERIELGHSRQTSQDIRKYLQDGFDEIYERNRDVMGDVAKPWPAVDRVNMFVRNASGQFVYASTVLKFIGSYSDYSDPQQQLEVISKPGPSRAEAFSPLDQLYTTILSNYPRRNELLRVLSGLFIKANLRTIVHCLDVSSGELKMVLRAISSLVKYPRSRVNIDNKELEVAFGPLDQNPISFAHLSFRDFLQDKARSQEFWVDTKEVYSKLYDKLIDTFVTQLRKGLNDQSHSNFRPKIVIPIAYDEYWGAYLYSTIPKNTPSSIVIERLHDLRDALNAFLLGFNDTTNSHLEDLLQTMHAARKFTASLREDSLLSEADFTVTEHKELVSQIRKVMDICFQRTISVERFIQAPNAPIFILGGSGSMTLEGISKSLDIPDARAVEFLKDNKHLIECDNELVYYREQKLDVLTRDYTCIQSVVAFLMDEKRSGALHRSFREAAIKTWTELVVRLVRVPDTPLSEDAHSFIWELLKKKTLIRLRNKIDLGIMLPLFTELCELDWSTLDVVDGEEDVFLTAFNVLRFLHQTLNSPKSVGLMTPNFRSAISTAMEKMYDALILRPTSANYFSEVPLLSDDVFGIPPHNINPADDEHVQDYESVLTDNLDHLQEMLRGPESAKYKLPIDRVVMCTSILEFLLRVWVTKFYQDSECPIGRYVGLRCRFLFDHANPSEKIRLALWTLRDLDSKTKLKPNLPISIVVSAREFIERHQLQMGPQKDLLTWLDELKARSVARKETHPDSDVPSDVESIEDDESDLTDINHDDDHGYEIDGEEKEEQPSLQEEEDFDSIYDWGD